MWYMTVNALSRLKSQKNLLSKLLSLLLFRVHHRLLLSLLFRFEGYFIGFLFHSSHLQNDKETRQSTRTVYVCTLRDGRT